MRLTEEQKAEVLESFSWHASDATLVRIGDRWAVVGRDREKSLWLGRLVVSVEDGKFWWTAETRSGLRREVIELLTEAAR